MIKEKLKAITGYNQSCRESKLIQAFEVFAIFQATRIPCTHSKMASDSENTTYTMEDTAAKLRLTQSFGLEDVVSSLKTFEAAELFKLLKAVTSEAEKKTKQTKTTVKPTAAKKSGSMPKGTIPPQLKKPRAWVEFTLKDALENGWEAFTVVQKKRDKETNIITEEQIEMPGSILHDGAYIFEGSVTDKTPQGRQIIHKEAMSLSKQRKDANHPTYSKFEAEYVDEGSDDDKSVVSSTSSKKIVVKMTAAEKEAEAAAKKAAKEAEKAAAKAAKEAEKAAAKAAKEAEKAEAKAAKDAEKASKKPVATKAPVPAVVKKAAVKTEPVATDAKVVPQAVQKKKPVTKVEEIPNDGMVHPCTIKGKKYLRNFEGETWTVGAGGGVGEWAGMYDVKADKLDTSAPEPVFEDEE